MVPVETFDGVIDFLFVYNLMHISNAVYSKTYSEDGISTVEHHGFVEARALCRAILGWLDNRFLFEDKATSTVKSIAQAQDDFLRHQLVALLHYKEVAMKQEFRSYQMGCTLEAFEREIRLLYHSKLDYKPNAGEDMASLSLSLGWPSSKTYTLRPTPMVSRKDLSYWRRFCSFCDSLLLIISYRQLL